MIELVEGESMNRPHKNKSECYCGYKSNFFYISGAALCFDIKAATPQSILCLSCSSGSALELT